MLQMLFRILRLITLSIGLANLVLIFHNDVIYTKEGDSKI